MARAKAKKTKSKPAPRSRARATRRAKPAQKRQAAKAKAKAKAKAQAKAKAKAKAPARATAKASPARASSRPSSRPDPVVADWRATLREELDGVGDFALHLRSLASQAAWEFADTPELAGLEAWGTALAMRDRAAGIGALVRAAQFGFPRVDAAGGVGLDGMGFRAGEESMDGAPVETQIQRAAEWLDAQTPAAKAAVAAANDPSRQLQIWDDDLRPPDDRAHWWYLDVGQCCGHAITRSAGDPAGHSYYDWPPETCVGRGLVLAVRGLREPRTDITALLRELRAAMVA